MDLWVVNYWNKNQEYSGYADNDGNNDWNLHRSYPIRLFNTEIDQSSTRPSVEHPHRETEVINQSVEVVWNNHDYCKTTLRRDIASVGNAPGEIHTINK